MENKASLTPATLGRLPDYLRLLKSASFQNTPNVSATVIAKSLSLGEVLVRKDLRAVSGEGKPKTGYVTSDLIRRLESILGYDHLTSAVLVGAGKLGRALLDYDEFEDYGVKIIAAFDHNDHILHLNQSIEILPMKHFENFCTDHHVQIGIITVGEGSAQEVCDKMIKSGIHAIWNFAPCKLNIPKDVLVKQEKLALSLAHLNNQLCNKIQEDTHGKHDL